MKFLLLTLLTLFSITSHALHDHQMDSISKSYSKITKHCLGTLGLTGLDLSNCMANAIAAEKASMVSALQNELDNYTLLVSDTSSHIAEINSFDFSTAASSILVAKVEAACSKVHLAEINFTNSVDPGSIVLTGTESCMALKMLLSTYKATYAPN